MEQTNSLLAARSPLNLKSAIVSARMDYQSSCIDLSLECTGLYSASRGSVHCSNCPHAVIKDLSKKSETSSSDRLGSIGLSSRIGRMILRKTRRVVFLSVETHEHIKDTSATDPFYL
jgi:hypothetical protein